MPEYIRFKCSFNAHSRHALLRPPPIHAELHLKEIPLKTRPPDRARRFNIPAQTITSWDSHSRREPDRWNFNLVTPRLSSGHAVSPSGGFRRPSIRTLLMAIQ